MKWAEVITVRSTRHNSSMLDSALRELFRDAAEMGGHERIRMYHRKGVDTDFCIVLFHERKRSKAGESRLGLRLSAALQEFGLVHHAVWLEMETE